MENNNKDIYSIIESDYLSNQELEYRISAFMCGKSYPDVPLRTRSRLIKEDICTALGYKIPKSFKKTQPKFIAQNFDVYAQKSNNLQIWNDKLDLNRRYVILKLGAHDEIQKVKVLTGHDLIALDKTNKLTIKHQAILKTGHKSAELISAVDTNYIRENLADDHDFFLQNQSPIGQPVKNQLYSINKIYNLLLPLIGYSFSDSGFDQERNRAFELHKAICKQLNYKSALDNGQFPDIPNQLIEVKLQTSQTVDLGTHSPDDITPLPNKYIDFEMISAADIRYVIFYAEIHEGKVCLKNLYVTTGKDFFTRIPQMQGKKVNSKLQIPLNDDLFI